MYSKFRDEVVNSLEINYRFYEETKTAFTDKKKCIWKW